jgi:NAD(P) transhydrogenase subunit beta
MQPNLILISYIFSAILFILGIKKLGKVNTARQGNFLSAIGMLIAIIERKLPCRAVFTFPSFLIPSINRMAEKI